MPTNTGSRRRKADPSDQLVLVCYSQSAGARAPARRLRMRDARQSLQSPSLIALQALGVTGAAAAANITTTDGRSRP